MEVQRKGDTLRRVNLRGFTYRSVMRFFHLTFLICCFLGSKLHAQTNSRFLVHIPDFVLNDTTGTYHGTYNSNDIYGTKTDSVFFNLVVVHKNGVRDSGRYRLIEPDFSFIPEGYSYQFYSSGSIHIKGNFKNGLQDSVWSYYFSNGKLYLTETYFLDQLHGPSSSFYENGNVKSNGDYSYGRKVGQWRFYYENGTLKSKGTFVIIPYEQETMFSAPGDRLKMDIFNEQVNDAGIKDGKWNYFNPKGELVRREFYNRGVIKKIKFYD